jgi:hypothetical protein
MSQAAHIRMANHSLGKLPTGMREKPSDMWSVPLCGPKLGQFPAVIGCHAEQHDMNERDFWDRAGMDPFVISAWNYAKYRSTKPAEPAGEPTSSKPRKAKTKPKANRNPPGGYRWASKPFPKTKRKFRT